MGTLLQSYTVSATTTSINTAFSGKISSVLLRTPSTNTDDVFVILGNSVVTPGNTLRLPPNSIISIDVESSLLSRALRNLPLSQDDFINSFTQRSNSGTQTLFVDAQQYSES